MIVIGHRGASAYAPENTMPAFELAREQGAHGIEIDVHRTRDSRVVVTHDFTADRVSDGSGPVAEKTMDELGELDFGAKFDKRFTGVRVPILEDVLAFIRDNDLLLNIEIKMNPLRYDTELVRLVADMIRGEKFFDRIIISSFDHKALVDVKKLCPGVKTGILYSCAMVDVWTYAAHIGAEYIHPEHRTLTAECASGCRSHGIGVNAWTADDPADIARLIGIGVDAVITNKPDVALSLLGIK